MARITTRKATEGDRASGSPRRTAHSLVVRLCAALLPLLASCLAGIAPASLASAADQAECTTRCHEKVAKGKFVHPDAADKCETCHGAIPMGDGPHRAPGRTSKGLIKDSPALCHQCHERGDFLGKYAHAPVEGAPCSECHVAHASDNPGLLRKDAATLCIDCHEEVKGRPHVAAAFSRSSHPLGNEKPPGTVHDPLNAARPFSCVSCHEPHRAAFPRLLRMDLNLAGGYCVKCHPM